MIEENDLADQLEKKYCHGKLPYRGNGQCPHLKLIPETCTMRFRNPMKPYLVHIFANDNQWELRKSND